MLKKLLILSLFSLFFSSSFAWVYPLKQVSKPTAFCKFRPWSSLGSSCKISLPKLTPKDYKKYLNNLTYRRIYTVLWMGSYTYGWDIMHGSHLGVDIATSLGTPVYSIGNGKVVFVGWKRGWGKTIVIRYPVNGKYIYTNYAHLNRIFVKFGQYVKEGQKVGEVGHSGNSRGNHLHFQIDLNQSISYHPRWFVNCHYSIDKITNSTICQAQALKNTIDPLEFLATNGAIVKFSNPSEIIKKEIPKISRKNMISYEEIRKQMIKEFLATHKFTFKFPNAGVYKLGKYGYFYITLKDKQGRNYKDILPGELDIIYDKNYFSAFYPRGLLVLNGTRKITFLPKKTGVTFITVKLGDFVIYQRLIRIVKPGQVFYPQHGQIITYPKHLYVSYPAWGINIFQDKGYMNLINVPFAGKYYLSSTTNDVIFCKIPPNLKYLNYYQCTPLNSSRTLEFSFKDTLFGLLVFKFYSNTGKSTKLIVKNSKGKIISESRKLYFSSIKLTNTNSPYKNDILQACKKGLCIGLIDKGYIWVDKPLSVYDMKLLLRNFLQIFGKKVSVNLNTAEKFKYVTRKKFVEDVFKLLGIKIKNYNQTPHYIDVRNEDKYFQNLTIYLTKLGFKWKDQFAKYYFQPNKNITIGEALYFVNFLVDKYKR